MTNSIMLRVVTVSYTHVITCTISILIQSSVSESVSVTKIMLPHWPVRYKMVNLPHSQERSIVKHKKQI